MFYWTGLRLNRITLVLVILTSTNLSHGELSNYESHPVFVGSYTLPVNQDLASYASWKLQDLKWIKNNEAVEAKYRMPGDLLQESSQEITMRGVIKKGYPFFSMSGPQVQSACTEIASGTFVCLVKFNKKQLATREDESFFKSQYKDAKEAQNRILVAQKFGLDPIGIIRIERR